MAVSPKLALGSLAVALVAVAVVVVQLGFLDDEEIPVEVAAIAEPPAVVEPAKPDVPPPPTPPEIKGLEVAVLPVANALELKLAVAVVLHAVAGRREMVSVRARCLVGAEWLDGHGSLPLSKLGGGTSVVTTKVAIRGGNDLVVAPTACHIGFDYYSGVRSIARRSLAHKCWDGTKVLDQPCEPIARGENTPVTVDEVRVASSLERRRTYIAGTPLHLDVTIGGRVRASMRDWSVELAADCRMPDGSTQRDRGTFSLYRAEIGEPFTKQTTAFSRSKLSADPESCTLTFELVDRSKLVREPLDVQCWRSGTIDRGACKVV